MAYSKNAPFRADVVGSYLRPAELKQARADFAAGTIDAAGLKAVEDRLITELVAKQKAAGLHVITDGEFRRGWWHFDFMWGFNGVDHVAAAHRVAFHDEVTPADTAVSLVVGPEGGFDPAEVEAVTAAGGRIATLGPRILRCETAPIAAIAVLMEKSGNMA